MKRMDGRYEHTGRTLSFLASPTAMLGALSVIGAVALQLGAELIARRYLRWLLPLVKRGRPITASAAAASMWASLGITILRIGHHVYVEGVWLDARDILAVATPAAPNPMHGNHHTIVCSDGRRVKTQVDASVFERHGCIGR